MKVTASRRAASGDGRAIGFPQGPPVPIPTKARPPESSSMVADALAMTRGWRVTGSVTPCPMRISLVLSAAIVIIASTSRPRKGMSTTETYLKPHSSATRAWSPTSWMLSVRPIPTAKSIVACSVEAACARRILSACPALLPGAVSRRRDRPGTTPQEHNGHRPGGKASRSALALVLSARTPRGRDRKRSAANPPDPVSRRSGPTGYRPRRASLRQ